MDGCGRRGGQGRVRVRACVCVCARVCVDMRVRARVRKWDVVKVVSVRLGCDECTTESSLPQHSSDSFYVNLLRVRQLSPATGSKAVVQSTSREQSLWFAEETWCRLSTIVDPG